MSFWLLVPVMLIYAGVAISEFIKGHYSMALVFFSYGLSIIGFLMELR